MAKGITKLTIVILFIALCGYSIVCGLSLGGINIPVRFYSALDPEFGMRQGFDFAGGAVVVYEAADSAPTDEQLTAVADIIHSRLVNLGFSETIPVKQGNNRISVAVPSVTDPDEVVRILGATAELKFVDSDGITILTGKDVEDASAQYGPMEQDGESVHYVELSLSREAQQAFYEGTSRMSQKEEGENYISIMLDEEVYSRPQVTTPINSNKAVISGDFDMQSAEELASTIREGQLPFKLTVAESESVGSPYGENSLNASILAGFIGLILIMLLMIVFYRLHGFAISVSLAAYAVAFVMTMLALRINLSLPSVAGILLSVAMAVDANIITIERIKGEFKTGKSDVAAAKSGLKKAMGTILETNVAVVVAAAAFYVFGTGALKGFAITLGIGLIINVVFTAVLTRFLVNAVVGMNIQNPLLCGLNPKEKEEKQDD